MRSLVLILALLTTTLAHAENVLRVRGAAYLEKGDKTYLSTSGVSVTKGEVVLLGEADTPEAAPILRAEVLNAMGAGALVKVLGPIETP